MRKFSKYYAKVVKKWNKKTGILQIQQKLNPYLLNWEENYHYEFSMFKRRFYRLFGYREGVALSYYGFEAYVHMPDEEEEIAFYEERNETAMKYSQVIKLLKNSSLIHQQSCEKQENFNVLHAIINFILQPQIKWFYIGYEERRELTLLVLEAGFDLFSKVESFKEICFWFRFLKPIPDRVYLKSCPWLSYGGGFLNYKYKISRDTMRIPKKLILGLSRRYLLKYKRKYNSPKLRGKLTYIRRLKLFNMRQVYLYDKYKFFDDMRATYNNINYFNGFYVRFFALHGCVPNTN